jgi:long-chain acyl-CoA synthetase
MKGDPLISQVLIIGDRRRFVSALVTISEENVAKWAQEAKLSALGYAELVKRPEVRARVQAAVDALNETLPQYATIKKFEILDQDWSQISGEMTPKLSVRRKVVEAKFKKTIDDIYGGERFE